jgi:hypothetical protein
MEIQPRLTEAGTLQPSRQSDEQTIAGLLAKRAKLFNEARRLRQSLAEVTNDVGAIDRVLDAFGYEGELDKIMPEEKGGRMFHNGQLMRRCLQEVRENGPVTSRDIAVKIITERGEDPDDLKYLQAVTDSVARRMRLERKRGHVRSVKGEGHALLWDRA